MAALSLDRVVVPVADAGCGWTVGGALRPARCRHEHRRHDGRHHDRRLDGLDRFLGRGADEVAVGQRLDAVLVFLRLLLAEYVVLHARGLGQGQGDDRARFDVGRLGKNRFGQALAHVTLGIAVE